MDISLGDVVLVSDQVAKIWDGSAFLDVAEAQISLDYEGARATVRMGSAPIAPTGNLILNAPAFHGWTGEVVVAGEATEAQDPRDLNADNNGGGGGGGE